MMDMSDQNSAAEDRPTQPREEIRRLVDPNPESLEPNTDLTPGGADAAGIDEASHPENGELSDPAQIDASDGAGPEASALPEAEESTGPAEPPVSESPAETGEPPDRHPTGEPEKTGGWYAPPSPEIKPDPAAPIPEVPDRHPTGDPEQTGGWYTPDPDATRVNIPSQPANDQTRVSQSSGRPRSRTGAGRTIPSSIPVDENGLPLPNRVEEVDRYATRVTPAAYGPSAYPPVTRRAEASPVAQPTRASSPTGRTAAVPRSAWRNSLGCLLRIVIALVFIGIIAVVLAGSFAVYQYYTIAASLPNVNDLKVRAAKFETTRILDRNGNVLYDILDPNAGRRTYVPLERISPYLIAATLATEDKEFYNHPGFDAWAILRAFWTNYTTGETVSGASTITQQLARMLLLSPEEAAKRTYERKIREAVLAMEITRRYSKEEILELYLNEIYYGNLAYGVEAAAETYFNTSSDKLTLSQGAFLAGLPQAPAVYDIYNNRADTLNRHKQVLILAYQVSQEKNCIYVSTNLQRVCVDATTAADAAVEMEAYDFQQQSGEIRYPHWVNYVRSILESQYDSQTIYRSGFTVYTTIDPGLQDQAEQIVKQQVSSLADRNVTDGALIALRPTTGEILTMVGSADFYNDAIAGQVNMAVSPRQPGSAIKPLTYAAAFEKGWTPATLIWDVPSEFPPSGIPNDPSPPYKPVNYDERFRGPVTVRSALSNSLNVPAVKTLNFVGIYDDPNLPGQDGLISFAQRMGITSLTRNEYGLSLTLGGGEVSLLELTGAFGIFANEGRRVAPVAITKIIDHEGNLVYEYTPPIGDQVIRAEHAFLITSILSDNNARAPVFGTNSVLALPFPAAAKTGTTNDFRDNWTVGYTPDLAVGVWVGNADYTPMQNTTGLTGAAPIWAEFMQLAEQALTGGNPRPFGRPAGIIERVICSVSGTEPSQWCPEQRTEFFAADQPPLPKERDLWQRVRIDTWSGYSASPACPEFLDEKFAINTYGDTWAVKWIKDTDQGRAWADSIGFTQPIFVAPDRECKPEDPHANLRFTNLTEGQTITANPLEIFAVIDGGNDHRHWRLEYGLGDEPNEWIGLIGDTGSLYNQPDKIYTWDMKDIPSGRVTLRLYLESTEDTYAERKVHLNLQVPTPTATSTATATVTSTITPTPTVTQTPVPPTSTFTPPPTQTNTPVTPAPTTPN